MEIGRSIQLIFIEGICLYCILGCLLHAHRGRTSFRANDWKAVPFELVWQNLPHA